MAQDRLIHVMVTARVRDENLRLITNVEEDLSDKRPGMYETHIILPPQDMAGNSNPVPGTDHGFLHLMFEGVTLSSL